MSTPSVVTLTPIQTKRCIIRLSFRYLPNLRRPSAEEQEKNRIAKFTNPCAPFLHVLVATRSLFCYLTPHVTTDGMLLDEAALLLVSQAPTFCFSLQVHLTVNLYTNDTKKALLEASPGSEKEFETTFRQRTLRAVSELSKATLVQRLSLPIAHFEDLRDALAHQVSQLHRLESLNWWFPSFPRSGSGCLIAPPPAPSVPSLVVIQAPLLVLDVVYRANDDEIRRLLEQSKRTLRSLTLTTHRHGDDEHLEGVMPMKLVRDIPRICPRLAELSVGSAMPPSNTWPGAKTEKRLNPEDDEPFSMEWIRDFAGLKMLKFNSTFHIKKRSSVASSADDSVQKITIASFSALQSQAHSLEILEFIGCSFGSDTALYAMCGKCPPGLQRKDEVVGVGVTFKHLTQLHFQSCLYVSGDAVARCLDCNAFPVLTSLNLGICVDSGIGIVITPSLCDTISSHSSLTKLKLHNRCLDSSSLSASATTINSPLNQMVAKLPLLRELHIGELISLFSPNVPLQLSGFGNLQNMHTLVILESSLCTDHLLETICLNMNKTLVKLTLFQSKGADSTNARCEISDDAISKFLPLLAENLDELHLYHLVNVTDEVFADVICNFHHLTGLSLAYSPNIGDLTAKSVSQLWCLDSLDVGGTKLSGEGMKYIGLLPRLGCLFVPDCVNLTAAEDFMPLATMTSMYYLDIYSFGDVTECKKLTEEVLADVVREGLYIATPLVT